MADSWWLCKPEEFSRKRAERQSEMTGDRKFGNTDDPTWAPSVTKYKPLGEHRKASKAVKVRPA